MQVLLADSVAQAIIIISLVGAFGLALGNLRVRQVNLGIAGVLFVGILFGHYRITVQPAVLEFLREFGLILFVYTIGLQVGPAFFSSFKKEGLRLNGLAALVVALGSVLTYALCRWGGVDAASAVGLYSGAVTNTPSLAAAEQALKDVPGLAEEALRRPGIGYALAYPFGILGTILAMILARWVFGVDEAAEAREAEAKPGFSHMSILVENKNFDGLSVERIPALEALKVRVSRILHEGTVSVAQGDTQVRVGDTLLAVGAKEKLEELALMVGRPSDKDLRAMPSAITNSRIIATRPEVLGKTLEELDLEDRYGVVVTRVARAEIEFMAGPGYRVHFGDALNAVGEEASLKQAAALLGNSPKTLNHPQLIPVFVGISLGVLLGQLPIVLPGTGTVVRLGLAGGPLVVAVLLSRIRQIGTVSWYMPISANFMLRELGIILFLACVGLKAGDRFAETLLRGEGLYWMACASLITFVPLAAVAALARLRYKTTYATLCGLLAGSMTDPPALSYANARVPSGAASLAYATVYPLVMLLRVVSAQLLIHLGLN